MKKTEKQSIIQSHCFFENFSQSLIDTFSEKILFKQIPAGHTIFFEGDMCQAIGFVLSGTIRVYKTAESGREITLYEVGAGDICILNASCLMSDIPYPATAVVTQPLEMLLMTAGDFKSVYPKELAIQQSIFKMLSGKLASLMELINEVTFRKLDERLIEYIKLKAVNNRLEITHQKIASDLGSSREVISRLLKDLEHKEQVVLSRNLIKLIPM